MVIPTIGPPKCGQFASLSTHFATFNVASCQLQSYVTSTYVMSCTHVQALKVGGWVCVRGMVYAVSPFHYVFRDFLPPAAPILDPEASLESQAGTTT